MGCNLRRSRYFGADRSAGYHRYRPGGGLYHTTGLVGAVDFDYSRRRGCPAGHLHPHHVATEFPAVTTTDQHLVANLLGRVTVDPILQFPSGTIPSHGRCRIFGSPLTGRTPIPTHRGDERPGVGSVPSSSCVGTLFGHSTGQGHLAVRRTFWSCAAQC